MTQALWRCPACGQTFVSRNMPHSCQVVGLDAFFAGAAPVLRDLFDRFVATAGAGGPLTVNATKSRVALQVRMRFAGIDRPRKAHLVANFVLTRPLASPRLMRVEPLAPYYYVHRLRLREPADVDAELAGWLAEAYGVGAQRHLTESDWLRVPV
jgi:ABC-type antimicrobial peptide transport system permease subunit